MLVDALQYGLPHRLFSQLQRFMAGLLCWKAVLHTQAFPSPGAQGTRLPLSSMSGAVQAGQAKDELEHVQRQLSQLLMRALHRLRPAVAVASPHSSGRQPSRVRRGQQQRLPLLRQHAQRAPPAQAPSSFHRPLATASACNA